MDIFKFVRYNQVLMRKSIRTCDQWGFILLFFNGQIQWTNSVFANAVAAKKHMPLVVLTYHAAFHA